MQQAPASRNPASGTPLPADAVGRKLRVPLMAVYELVRAGLLPAVHVGRRLRVREEAIVTVLEQEMDRAKKNSA